MILIAGEKLIAAYARQADPNSLLVEYPTNCVVYDEIRSVKRLLHRQDKQLQVRPQPGGIRLGYQVADSEPLCYRPREGPFIPLSLFKSNRISVQIRILQTRCHRDDA